MRRHGVGVIRGGLGQVASLSAGLQPNEQQQCAFGVGQGAPLEEELVQALAGQTQHAGQFGFFTAPDELGPHDGGEFVPQRRIGARFDREPASRPAFACGLFDSVPNRFSRGLREGIDEVEGNRERGG